MYAVCAGYEAQTVCDALHTSANYTATWLQSSMFPQMVYSWDVPLQITEILSSSFIATDCNP
jgi:hypothetical protein